MIFLCICWRICWNVSCGKLRVAAQNALQSLVDVMRCKLVRLAFQSCMRQIAAIGRCWCIDLACGRLLEPLYNRSCIVATDTSPARLDFATFLIPARAWSIGPQSSGFHMHASCFVLTAAWNCSALRMPNNFRIQWIGLFYSIVFSVGLWQSLNQNTQQCGAASLEGLDASCIACSGQKRMLKGACRSTSARWCMWYFVLRCLVGVPRCNSSVWLTLPRIAKRTSCLVLRNLV